MSIRHSPHRTRSPTRAAGHTAPSLAQLQTTRARSHVDTSLWDIPFDLMVPTSTQSIQNAKDNLLCGDGNAIGAFVETLVTALRHTRTMCQPINRELSGACHAYFHALCKVADFLPSGELQVQNNGLWVAEKWRSWKEHYVTCLRFLQGGTIAPNRQELPWSQIKVLCVVAVEVKCIAIKRALLHLKKKMSRVSEVSSLLTEAFAFTLDVCGPHHQYHEKVRPGWFSASAWRALCQAAAFLPPGQLKVQGDGFYLHLGGWRSWYTHFVECKELMKLPDLLQLGEVHWTRNIKGIVLTSVANNFKNMEFVSPELRRDEDVLLVAIRNGGAEALQFVPVDLRASLAFMKKVVSVNENLVRHAPTTMHAELLHTLYMLRVAAANAIRPLLMQTYDETDDDEDG